MYWDLLTSPQIAALDKSMPVILPISATEQHGSHLPLATDRMIGEHLCRHINEKIENDILILPIISVGCSEHHTDFAGSLSVQHSTMLSQMTDIMNCVASYGFNKLFILNSHGGNQGIAQTFIETFGFRNPSVDIAYTSWWRMANEEIRSIQDSGPGGVGHAGEFETSLMMLIAPDLVHDDQIEERANIPTYNWAEADLVSGSKVSYYRRMNEVTPNGVQGEPKLASKEKGLRLTEKIVDVFVSTLTEYRGKS